MHPVLTRDIISVVISYLSSADIISLSELNRTVHSCIFNNSMILFILRERIHELSDILKYLDIDFYLKFLYSIERVNTHVDILDVDINNLLIDITLYELNNYHKVTPDMIESIIDKIDTADKETRYNTYFLLDMEDLVADDDNYYIGIYCSIYLVMSARLLDSDLLYVVTEYCEDDDFIELFVYLDKLDLDIEENLDFIIDATDLYTSSYTSNDLFDIIVNNNLLNLYSHIQKRYFYIDDFNVDSIYYKFGRFEAKEFIEFLVDKGYVGTYMYSFAGDNVKLLEKMIKLKEPEYYEQFKGAIVSAIRTGSLEVLRYLIHITPKDILGWIKEARIMRSNPYMYDIYEGQRIGQVVTRFLDTY